MSRPPQPSNTASESIKCSVSDCWRLLQKLRSDCPLVQCITNYVSMDIMANTLLAIGASPCMVHGKVNISTFLYTGGESPGVIKILIQNSYRIFLYVMPF